MKTLRMRRSAWLVPAGLIVLSLVPAIAGTARLSELAGDPEVTAANQRFVDMPLPIVLHVLSVIPYSLLGAFQFSSEFRRRFRGWHRIAGRLLVLSGFVVALSGLWMTFAYPWANNDGEAVYIERIVVGFAMLAFMILGVDAIRQRDFNAHGRWMIRAYAVALGAGTQVLTHLPWFILIGKTTTELSRAIMMGAAWAINAAVAEWIIRSSQGQKKPSSPRADSIRQTRKPRSEPHHAY